MSDINVTPLERAARAVIKSDADLIEDEFRQRHGNGPKASPAPSCWRYGSRHRRWCAKEGDTFIHPKHSPQ